ncbi:hypothetical protein GJ496_009223 [Pomphorhynchus laevis]|nr:hypothetical protein GJ496_009223 [Pomphorhynchus laevis]
MFQTPFSLWKNTELVKLSSKLNTLNEEIDNDNLKSIEFCEIWKKFREKFRGKIKHSTKLCGSFYNVIHEVLTPYEICAHDDIRYSKSFMKSNGVPQDNPLSLLPCSIFISDFPTFIYKSGASCLMYADDLAIYSIDPGSIQHALRVLDHSYMVVVYRHMKYSRLIIPFADVH